MSLNDQTQAEEAKRWEEFYRAHVRCIKCGEPKGKPDCEACNKRTKSEIK